MRLKRFVAFAILLISFESQSNEFSDQLAKAAIERTRYEVRYDGSYYTIPYPNGDVPSNVGVCTDVVIRSYRSIGIDLQKRVHEDMTLSFDDYPSSRIWGLSGPDSNIDHRRVPNLQRFFERNGTSLPITSDAEKYEPGEMVTWMLPGNLPHIGIVTNIQSLETGMPLIAHNIGRGPELQDMLFKYEITGRYWYEPIGQDD